MEEMMLVIVVQPTREREGSYPLEARLAGTTYRGVGYTVEEAIADLWTSPAREVIEKVDGAQPWQRK